MPSPKKAEDTSTPPVKKPSPTKVAAARTTAKPPAAKAPAATSAAAKAPAGKAAAGRSTAAKATAGKATAGKATAAKTATGKVAAGEAVGATAATTSTAPAKRATARVAPSPAEPVAVLGGGDEFLAAQRALLLQEREAHTRQAAGLRAEAEQLAEERDPGDVQFDEESGQGDTMNVERERDLALSAQAMQQVLEIDVALDKIDKGTYGLCERCGTPIPEERLQALPWAALDVSCKSMGFARR